MGFFSEMEESYSQPEVEQDGQDAVDDAFEELETKQVQVAKAAKDEDQALAEVDVRIRKANFYRSVLNGTLFDNGDEVAAEVEKEFRAFAAGRLRVLMGMETEVKPQAPAPSQFPPDEAKVLRLWASKLLKKPTIMQVEPPKGKLPPGSMPSTAPAKPVPQTTASVEPRLNRVNVPTMTPIKRGPGRPPGTGKNQVLKKNEKALPEGVEVDENGRKFIMVERGTDEKGNARFVKMDVTPPVQIEGLKPAPMPTQEQALMMEIIKADQVPKSGDLTKIINKVQE